MGQSLRCLSVSQVRTLHRLPVINTSHSSSRLYWTMLIQGDVKNLRPVQCFIRDDSLRGAADKYPCEQTSSANPFQPGGPLSEEGDTMVDLWRQGRLAMYCQQEGEANRHRQSHQQNEEGEIPSEMRRNVTLVQRREKFTSLCCFG